MPKETETVSGKLFFYLENESVPLDHYLTPKMDSAALRSIPPTSFPPPRVYSEIETLGLWLLVSCHSAYRCAITAKAMGRNRPHWLLHFRISAVQNQEY